MEIKNCFSIDKNEVIQLINNKHLNLIDLYTEKLLYYNNKFNLTSITNKEEIFVKHFLDSLSGLILLKKLFKDDLKTLKIVDIGTGAGFPGVVLKLFYPELDITLVESNTKKAQFLQIISSLLRIDINISNKNVKETKGNYDIFLSRGFSDIYTFIKLTKHLYNKTKTHLIFYKGKTNKIFEEFNVVKNRKIGLNIKEANLYKITGFNFNRNILELLWEKS